MDWVVTKYDHYSKITVSEEAKMIFPRKMIVALPNPDLQDDIRSDYLEATIRLKKMPLVRWCCLRPPMPPTTWATCFERGSCPKQAMCMFCTLQVATSA